VAELRKPLGLACSAGGALGAWQAAALLELEKDGLEFDRVLGASAGALNAAGYALGLGAELVERWKTVDASMLRFSPRFFPFSLCSAEPLRAALSFCSDDAANRGRLRRPLVIATARVDRKRRDYAHFEPGEGGRWDGDLLRHLVTSCAIPYVFPTAALGLDGWRGRSFDGFVPCEEPFRFEGLEGCRDIVVLEPVRPDELDRKTTGIFDEIELGCRKTIRMLTSQGIAGKRAADPEVRVFRLSPSRVLPFSMLGFKRENIESALALGRGDASAFLADPRRCVAA